MADESEHSLLEAQRLTFLKDMIKKIMVRRESKVITSLVNDYKTGTLTPENAYAKIMVIAELRYTGTDIGKKDLQ